MNSIANSLTANIIVTVMLVIMVFCMPLVDRLVCRKLGINIADGLSINPKADRLLHLRKIILAGTFFIYLAMVIYVTFFSREAYDDYHVHVALFEDLSNSIHIDFGFLSFIKAVFTEGLKSAFSHIQIINPVNIYQVYLNIVMFVPMGYLLPYVFDWFRRSVRRRTVLVCFLISLLIENLQLITKRGFYDIDDIFTNTLGGFIGQGLYVLAAYVLTHPDFRSELRRLRRWRRNARSGAMFPYFSRIHVQRATLFVPDRDEIYSFYGEKLGFRLKKLIPYGEKDGDYLFTFGNNEIEIICRSDNRDIPVQNITLACNNSEYLKKRLEKKGIAVSPYFSDQYTGLRCFTFGCPGNITITIIEE